MPAPARRSGPPPKPVHQPLGCDDCALLIRQLGETRLDERKKAVALILNLRKLPATTEWDVCANHTLEAAAQRLADLR
jgi:hypothetical protein